jgi:Ca2+-binding RTX toxin-like protein
VDHAGDKVKEFGSTASTEVDTVKSSVTFTLTNPTVADPDINVSRVENLELTGTGAINGTGNSLNNAITGNVAANTLDGSAGNDTLDGAAGNDTLSGGTGNDTYVVDANGDVVTETSTTTTEIDTVQSGVTYTLGANLENLTLTGNTAINGTGNSLNNAITGNVAANTLDGGAGNDTLSGGAGNDIYVVDANGDVVTETSTTTTEIDTVQSGVTYTLGANLENLSLTGNAAINGTGNSLNNAITGNAAANILDGGAGNDTLSGGAGNDTYVVDSTSDVVSETPTTVGEIDTVQSSVTHTLGANLENITLTGTNAINANGNALNNKITGNIAANTLDGGTGADSLYSGFFYTEVDGIAGYGTGDTILSNGNDTYIVDHAGDKVKEFGSTASTEVDTVKSSVTFTLTNPTVADPDINVTRVENLELTGTAVINGTGNALANKITGNIAANTLDGGTGADSLYSGFFYTEVDGIAGYGTGDTILSNGNDTYIVDHAGDKVKEFGSTASTEVDTVKSSVTFTLTNPTVADADINVNRVENLELTGTGAINGTGNALNNKITGNTAANTLDGAAGNDTLTGEAGVDRFLYDTNAVFATSAVGIDTITDFAVGTDKIVLDKTTFTALQSVAGNAFSVVSDFAIVSADSLAGASSGLIVYSSATDNLFYNPDGTTAGLASGGQFATLSGIDSLSASDFVIQA